MLITLKRFVREEDGMEMVEWAIVATVFAIASAALWGTLSGAIGSALTATGTCVSTGVCGPVAP